MLEFSSRSLMVSLLLTATLSLSCGPSAQSDGSTVVKPRDWEKATPARILPLAKAPDLAEGQRAFALAFHRDLATRKPGENLIFSPFSLAQAFSMTYAGARGETAAQMRKVLRLPDSGAHEGFQKLNQALSGPQGATLKIANRLFGQTGYAFESDFLGICSQRYLAPLEPLDFRAAPEQARGQINHWVENQTEQKIKDLLPERSLDSDTRLVLANAIYFKGSWLTQFQESATQPAPFWAQGTQELQVPTMRGKFEVNTGEGEGFQFLELPYRGEELSALILLPKARDGITRLEATLDPEQVEELVKTSEARKVQVLLPRFEIRTQLDLKAQMKSMGMEAAFDAQKADFSGMEPSRELYIGGAFHQAFVKVNEEGTEAAAATAVVMQRKSMPAPVPEFRVEHPFLFVIRHRASGSWLFLGRVNQPQ